MACIKDSKASGIFHDVFFLPPSDAGRQARVCVFHMRTLDSTLVGDSARTTCGPQEVDRPSRYHLTAPPE